MLGQGCPGGVGDIIPFDIPHNDGQVLDLDDASAFLSDLQIEDARTIVDNLLPPGGFDGNADGMVDDADLALWRQYFGFVSNSIGTAVSAAAPEPTALSLRLAGIAFGGLRRLRSS